MQVVWSEPAQQYLDAIVEYIAKDNLQAALDMDVLLREAADSLLQFPEKGRPGRIPGTRELIAHKHYTLVYVIVPGAVQIVTVLHSSRQWP